MMPMPILQDKSIDKIMQIDPDTTETIIQEEMDLSETETKILSEEEELDKDKEDKIETMKDHQSIITMIEEDLVIEKELTII